MVGTLEIIIGPMFSGKTTELLRRISEISNENVLIVKSSNDNRYSNDRVVTHDGTSVVATTVDTLEEIDDLVNRFQVVAIDEAHFFSDLSIYVPSWSDAGKRVIVTTLNSGHQRFFYDRVSRILGHAEKIDKLTSVCSLCGLEASYTYRYDWTEPEVWVGGREKYMPVCRACFLKLNGESSI